MKIKRLPLEYPEIPGDVNEKDFKAAIRERHQGYCNAMMEIEKTALHLASELEKQYNESVTEYVNSVGE